jgi:hypothetical protein
LTPTPGIAQGHPSRFAQFDTVYRHWAAAVDRAARENPSKKLRIAGPATGFWTLRYGSGQNWQNQIIEKFAGQGVRLDIVSLHLYGQDIDDFPKFAQSIRKTLVANGKPNAEIWITEWGPSNLSDPYFGAINGSNEGAAWAIVFLLQALKGTVTGGSFLEVRDNQGHDTAGVNSEMYEATWNHVENGVEYPKPVANSFSMIDRMEGTRRSVAANAAKPNLRGFASATSKSASLIVANYNYRFDYTHKKYEDLTRTENVSVKFKNLTFSGDVIVDRYLIDARTSNLNYWLHRKILPPSVQSTQLQKVESFSASPIAGELTLPDSQLDPSAVSLWIVRRKSPGD